MSKLSRNRNINLLTEFPCFAYKYSLMVVSKVTPIGILQAFFGLITCNELESRDSHCF